MLLTAWRERATADYVMFTGRQAAVLRLNWAIILCFTSASAAGAASPSLAIALIRV